MIQTVQGNLSILEGDRSLLDLSQAGSDPGTGPSFAQVMAVQQGIQEEPDDSGKASGDRGPITKNSFTGFFQEIQEERMEELREEILEEMGLTEEKLARMDPQARAQVEKLIAQKIQIRLMAQSAMDDDDPVKKEALMANIDMLSL